MGISFRKSIVTLGETLRHDFTLVAGWGRDIDQKLERRGLSPRTRQMLYGATALGGLGLAVISPLQMMGIAGFGVLQLGPFMRDNRYKRGNAVMGCALLAPQFYLLGAYVGALQVAVAGSRAQVMNTINDDSYKTRIVMSAAFWASAIGISHQAGLINSTMDVLPLAAMTCGTLADACPDKMTHIARAARIVGNGFLMPYHLIVSGSIAGLANEGLAATNHIRTGVQNDVPVRDENGNTLPTLRGQFAGWWKSVTAMERITPDRAGRADPLAETLGQMRRAISPQP